MECRLHSAKTTNFFRSLQQLVTPEARVNMSSFHATEQISGSLFSYGQAVDFHAERPEDPSGYDVRPFVVKNIYQYGLQPTVKQDE